MTRRSLPILALVIASLLLAACGEGSNRQIASNSEADQQTPAASTPSDRDRKKDEAKTTTTVGTVGAAVTIKDDLFEPAKVEITKGQAVAWKWGGKNPHNVDGPKFKSKIQTSGAFTRTFGQAGSFDYRCDVHPTMTGTVVVTG